jgi:hypothetical protein
VSEKIYSEMSDDEIRENAELGKHYAAANRRNGNIARAEAFEEGVKQDEEYLVHRSRLRAVKNLRNLPKL